MEFQRALENALRSFSEARRKQRENRASEAGSLECEAGCTDSAALLVRAAKALFSAERRKAESPTEGVSVGTLLRRRFDFDAEEDGNGGCLYTRLTYVSFEAQRFFAGEEAARALAVAQAGRTRPRERSAWEEAECVRRELKKERAALEYLLADEKASTEGAAETAAIRRKLSLTPASRQLLRILVEWILVPFRQCVVSSMHRGASPEAFAFAVTNWRLLSQAHFLQLEKVFSLLQTAILSAAEPLASPALLRVFPVVIFALYHEDSEEGGGEEAPSADFLCAAVERMRLSSNGFLFEVLKIKEPASASVQQQPLQRASNASLGRGAPAPAWQRRSFLFLGQNAFVAAPPPSPLPSAPSLAAFKCRALLDEIERRLLLPMRLRVDALLSPARRRASLRWEKVMRLSDPPPRLLLFNCQAVAASAQQQPDLQQERLSPQRLLLHLSRRASSCGIFWLFVPVTALASPYVGQSEQRLRQVFAAASASAPCVLVLLDVEGLAAVREFKRGGSASCPGESGSSPWRRRLLASLLLGLDALEDQRLASLQRAEAEETRWSLVGAAGLSSAAPRGEDVSASDAATPEEPAPPNFIPLPDGSRLREATRGEARRGAAAGVAVVGCTYGSPDCIDSAAVRAGRLDSWLDMGRFFDDGSPREAVPRGSEL